MDIESARQNMVDCQIKTWDVFDSAVIEAFRRIKREDFVPLKYKELAFADTMLDIGQNQQMMSPKVEARLLQALAIQATDKVLEVGTGTGHLTALLATLANKVFSFECDSELYHLSDDPSEQRNLVSRHPEVAQLLQRRIEDLQHGPLAATPGLIMTEAEKADVEKRLTELGYM